MPRRNWKERARKYKRQRDDQVELVLALSDECSRLTSGIQALETYTDDLMGTRASVDVRLLLAALAAGKSVVIVNGRPFLDASPRAKEPAP